MRYEQVRTLLDEKHEPGCMCAAHCVLDSWKDERANLRSVVTAAVKLGRLIPRRSLVRFLGRAERILAGTSR